MNALEFWLEYCRTSLIDAEKQLRKEQFAGSREVLRERIANYRKWIAQAEQQLGYKEAA